MTPAVLILIGVVIGIIVGYTLALVVNYVEYWSKDRTRMEMDDSIARLQEWQRRPAPKKGDPRHPVDWPRVRISNDGETYRNVR